MFQPNRTSLKAIIEDAANRIIPHIELEPLRARKTSNEIQNAIFDAAKHAARITFDKHATPQPNNLIEKMIAPDIQKAAIELQDGIAEDTVRRGIRGINFFDISNISERAALLISASSSAAEIQEILAKATMAILQEKIYNPYYREYRTIKPGQNHEDKEMVQRVRAAQHFYTNEHVDLLFVRDTTHDAADACISRFSEENKGDLISDVMRDHSATYLQEALNAPARQIHESLESRHTSRTAIDRLTSRANNGNQQER